MRQRDPFTASVFSELLNHMCISVVAGASSNLYCNVFVPPWLSAYADVCNVALSADF